MVRRNAKHMAGVDSGVTNQVPEEIAARAAKPKAREAQWREGQEISEKPVMVRTDIPPDELVRLAFLGLLGREPDTEALAVYTREFAEKKDLSAVLSVMGKSQEHWEKSLAERAEELVRAVYRGLLERDADPQGLNDYAKKLVEKKDLTEILASIISSDEFRTLQRRREARRIAGRRGVIDDVLAKKLVFLHVEKTAGTSMQNMIIDAFGKENVYHEHGDTLYWRSPAELNMYAVFAGHFNFDSITYIPSKNIEIFTFVRDPKKRLVSLYTFWRSHTHDAPAFHPSMALANQCDIEAFFKHEQITGGTSIWNHMTWCVMGHHQWLEWRRQLETLTGKERGNLLRSIRKLIRRRLREFLFVGLQEDFERSVDLLFNLLARPRPSSRVDHSIEQLMSVHSYFKKTEKPQITSDADAALNRLVELDNIVYQEARILYDERLAAFENRVGKSGAAPGSSAK